MSEIIQVDFGKVEEEELQLWHCECGSHEFHLYQDDCGVITADCAWCECDTDLEMCQLEEIENDGDSV